MLRTAPTFSWPATPVHEIWQAMVSSVNSSIGLVVAGVALVCGCALLRAWGPDSAVRLIMLDPAHFHVALVQEEMLSGVARRVVSS